MSFTELGLSPKVLSAVEASGYTTPTPIQERAIPSVLARRDVLGLAQTGTGKTASFTLPMLTMLETGRARARMPRTLILEPTRELAAQVEQSFARYGCNHKLNVALLIGGVSFGDQDTKLMKGVDVLIATPGRLLDHFERGRLLLTGIEILVIDEADRMLDMGFIPDIERICRLIPSKHQTLFFSATMPSEIQRLTDTFLRDPIRIEVAKPATTLDAVTQQLVATSKEPHDKRDVLRQLIGGAENLQNAIVFCNRKTEVATLHRSLLKYGFNVVALHGDMDQRARMQALDQFRTGEVKLLVASDVAARGLDIPEVSHVLNFDVPIHAEDYVHRIGRTGRAGRSGVALTLASPSDGKYLAAIEKLIGKPIPWLGNPPEPTASEPGSRTGSRDSSRSSGRGRSGSRREDRSAERAGTDESSGQPVEASGSPEIRQGVAEATDRPSRTPRQPRAPRTSRQQAAAAHGDGERSETSRSETGRGETARSDTARSETGRGETARSETARSDTARSDTARSDTARSDTGRANAGRADARRAGNVIPVPDRKGAAAKSRQSEDATPLAFGDHVPSFLLRPVKINKHA